MRVARRVSLEVKLFNFRMRTYIYFFILLTVSGLGIRDLLTEDPKPSHIQLIGHASSMEDSLLITDSGVHPVTESNATVLDQQILDDYTSLLGMGSTYPYSYDVVKESIRLRYINPFEGFSYTANTFKCCLKCSLFRNRYYGQNMFYVST